MLVSYNTVYNVSITATLCGQNGATTIVILNYGKLNNINFVAFYHDAIMKVKCSYPYKNVLQDLA